MRTRYKDLSLQQIRTFREVCRLKSYTEVAKSIVLSTSAVWEQMRGLERYFEVSLLENVGGEVLPTSDGQQLLELVTPLLSGLESTKEVLQQRRGRLPKKITIVSGLRMLTDEVADAIASFRQHYPSVGVQALYAPDNTIDQIINSGDADLAITLERGPEENSTQTVRHEFAYEYDYLLICPSKHPLSTKSKLRLADILKHPIILGAPGTRSRRRIDEVLHREGLIDELQIAMETNSTATTFAGVRAGVGIGIGAAPLHGWLSNGLAVRSLERWFDKARFVFVWKRGITLTPVQIKLAECIRSSKVSS